jgi:hypothetical protein
VQVCCRKTSESKNKNYVPNIFLCCGQAATLHHTLRSGFHSTANPQHAQQNGNSLSLITDLLLADEKKKSIYTKYANLAHAGIKSKGYTERACLFCFLAVARP